MTNIVIIVVSDNAITNGGIVLPNKISKEVKGLTISWSKVPISRSLAMVRAVNNNVITRANIATRTVKRYHRYSKLGLYQFLIVGFN